MDYQLTLGPLLRRAETLFRDREVVSRLPDRSFRRTTYGELARRARCLAAALRRLGIRPGDRVATLAWNHQEHLECYFGVPAAGAVLLTLNLRLHPDELAYVAADAGARAVVVDASLVPLLERFRERTAIEHVVVVGAGYEELLAGADESGLVEADPPESAAAAMCYTTGTTGRPKGVVYSHRALVLHTLASVAAFGLRRDDVVLPVVPMFHANAWGLPYAATLLGAGQVLPGAHLDAASLLEDFERERVTITAGVPTIWFGILDALDADSGRHDVSSLRGMLVGGAAAPRSLIAGFERHGLAVWHGWGMTELAPVGCTAREGDVDARVRQGQPIPLVEVRARGADGLVAWDGRTMGELEVRGAFVASAYHGGEDADRWTDDGWFRTGDIVTIEPDGTVAIQDRAKDLVKSGGEWISSVAVENAIMGHPAVAEAAVVAVPDERWGERPLAVVVARGAVTPDELREFLEPQFPRFWIPDAFELVDEIPRTSAGKFKKTELRGRYAHALRSL